MHISLHVFDAPDAVKRDLYFRGIFEILQHVKERVGNLGKCFRGGKAGELFHNIALGRTDVRPYSLGLKTLVAAFSNLVNAPRKTNSTLPTGPLRCLAMMISATLCLSLSFSY